MNDLQVTDIDEIRGVNHEKCHDIFINASMCVLELVPTGFQIYAEKACFFKLVPRKGNMVKKM